MKSATFLARYYYIIYHVKPYGSWFWHVHCMLRHFFAVFSEPGKYILQYFIDIPIKLGCKSDLNVWPYFLMLVALLTSSCFLLCKFPWFLFFYVCPLFSFHLLGIRFDQLYESPCHKFWLEWEGTGPYQVGHAACTGSFQHKSTTKTCGETSVMRESSAKFKWTLEKAFAFKMTHTSNQS